ncbi:MAG: carbohydrate-binding family 9-like protein [Lentisphaeria bacterium]
MKISEAKTLIVSAMQETHKTTAKWDAWGTLPINSMDFYMGKAPLHIPKVHFRIGYNSHSLMIIFRVKDRNVIARAKQWHDKVWEDSCVEFFFSPFGEKGYFNVETNCCGTMLLRYQQEPNKNIEFLDMESCSMISVTSSLNNLLEEELQEDLEWFLEYKLPFKALKALCNFKTPSSGDVWKGNFYKCADSCSTPHWLTWSKVNGEEPNFHVPEAFGSIIFE